MNGYEVVETAVRDRMLVHFASELTADTCKIADLDTLVKNVMEQGATYACIIDMGIPVGRAQVRESFSRPSWAWNIIGLFWIRITQERDATTDALVIDLQTRAVIDKIKSVFADDHTLGGKCLLAQVNMIENPEIVQLNDIPFHFILFQIECWDS